MGENANDQMGPVDTKATALTDKETDTITLHQTTEKSMKRPLTISTDQTAASTNPNTHINQHNKRLRLETVPQSIQSMNNKSKPKGAAFIYGNYDRYYGYRNSKDFKDNRLETFQNHRELFDGKTVLDIGCNNGLVTIFVARDLNVKRIVGIDIDKRLVDKARRFLINETKLHETSEGDCKTFPFNVEFKCGSYVLADERLLELEKAQFDTILCLSVTKWIQLNCGDVGIKLAFRRMYKQLVPGGRLILEAQDWKGYKRRKNLTPTIAENYKSIKLLPENFDQYLLSSEVGFQSMTTIDVPKNDAKGFQRPIKVRNALQIFKLTRADRLIFLHRSL